MTWSEIQIEALKKMFLNKDNLSVDELETYKQDKKYKTYLFAMRQACNEALTQIYALIEPNIGTHELEKTEQRFYDLSALIDDYEKISDIEVPENVKWKMVNQDIIQIDNWTTGKVTIYYEKEHVYITDETTSDSELDIDKKYATLIPLYIAGELYKDDDITMATIYLNEFNNMLSILTNNRSYINNNKISPIFRME